MTKTNVQPIPSNSKHHDTPNNKTHVIKFRVTEREKLELEQTAKLLHLSLSTLIRRALHSAKIERTVVVAGGGEETLNAVSTLLAQCSRVGGNLNQLARHFNSGGADTELIRAKILDELADLTAFRLHAEKVLGELYGNAHGMLFTDVQRSVRLNKKKKSTNTSPYPDEAIERLARAFYPAILACWNSEEGQREFAAWQAEQAHHAPSKEKQSVPDGELPVVHIVIVCGLWQGASYSGAHLVFILSLHQLIEFQPSAF